MEMQLKRVTKEELHRMIDEVPEDELMVLTYKKNIGISDNGKLLKKKKTKKDMEETKKEQELLEEARSNNKLVINE